MAENISPELYLSLLSGRYGDLSNLLPEHRDKDVGSCLYDPKFRKDDRTLDVLDALAGICVHNEQGDVFFVSLATESNTATLYVSTNGTVPATLIAHLRVIRRELRALKSVLEPTSSPPLDIEFPDLNNTLPGSEGELKIQQIIYKYSYKKVQRRFQKRGPEILAQYDAITKSLYSKVEVVTKDIDLLTITRGLLENIDNFLQDKSPQGPRFTSLIELIAILSVYWKRHLEAVEENDLLTQWDNLALVRKNRNLSLRRFFQKLFTLHNHIRAILRIAWSRRLSPILDGQFDVVPVPAACGDIAIEFSQPKVLHAAFPEDKEKGKVVESVKETVYNGLLRELKAKAEEEQVEIKEKEGASLELSLQRINVHAECNLLAYHLQRPGITPYRYFGGSKLSCHGCGVLFSSFNSVAPDFGHSKYFTKGCHDKIYLRWPYPSLLSQEQQMRLRPNTPSLDIEVKKAMIKALEGELVEYVSELRAAIERSTPPQSDSTSTSGDSRGLTEEDDLGPLEALYQLSSRVV